MKTDRTLSTAAVLIFVAICTSQVLAQQPGNPGIFQQYPGRISSTLRFWASDRGRDLLLHSPNPSAFALLEKFHPDAAGQYPLQPMLQPSPQGRRIVQPAVTVTGCGTNSGTVMNLEPAMNAVAQTQPSVDFLLSELGSGKDLVAEAANDERGLFGIFDSYTAEYVHRDGTVPCYGGTDFEMGNPPIADPFFAGSYLTSLGNARVLADANPAHKQFIFADVRDDSTTTGVGLRRIPATNFESTTTCPQGTLSITQEATCAGNTAIIVNASLDDESDSVSIAQDQRSSGTGAGDIYVVNASIRVLRSVIVLSACKETFATAADCSAPIIISGTQRVPEFPSVAVVQGGPNAGTIVIAYYGDDGFDFVSCTPGGAPAAPTCNAKQLVNDDPNTYTTLTDNPGLSISPWPQIGARTDASGQTLFIVWSDCKVSFGYPLTGCPDANIVMSTATGVNNPAWTVRNVRSSTGHQFLPAIAYDTGQNIMSIAYYDTGTNIYKNNVVMRMNQIASGTTTIGGTVVLTLDYDSVQGDGTEYLYSYYGAADYLGIAAHGGSGVGSSRVYVGFTNNARQGTYSGVSNTQADNNIVEATY